MQVAILAIGRGDKHVVAIPCQEGAAWQELPSVQLLMMACLLVDQHIRDKATAVLLICEMVFCPFD